MAAHFSIPSSFLLPSFRHTSGVFINFHASPRADAVHDLGLNGGSIGRSQVGQLPYNKFLIPELHWIPNDTRSSFTPFRAGTCFSAAATTVLSLSLSLLSCPQVPLSFEHASPLSDFRPRKKKKRKKTRREKKWRRKTKSRRRIWRRLEQKLVLEHGLEYLILPSTKPCNACSARLPLVWTEIKVTGSFFTGI